MPLIKITTEINSTLEICFDLARSIDLHQISTEKTREKAIAGKTRGLIGLDETVTWEATHFGVRQKMTSKITAYERPNYFIDEQVKGIFNFFVHQHNFESTDAGVLMIDILEFQSPLGILGRFFNSLVLTKYLTRFLEERNRVIKEYAESDQWKQVLDENLYKK